MRKIILIALFFAMTRIYAGGIEIVNHLVRPHETVFRISLMYNSTVNDIVEANPGLKPNEVRSGMTIKVPKDTKQRDSVFVAAFLKSPYASKKVETKSQITAQRQADENPFMGASGEGKTIEQIIEKPIQVNAPSQQPDSITQKYNSEELQARYIELRDQAAYDKNIKIIDVNSLKITTETAINK